MTHLYDRTHNGRTTRGYFYCGEPAWADPVRGPFPDWTDDVGGIGSRMTGWVLADPSRADCPACLNVLRVHGILSQKDIYDASFSQR
jgi:hypothetical protein